LSPDIAARSTQRFGSIAHAHAYLTVAAQTGDGMG
jgi:hypothetical protein